MEEMPLPVFALYTLSCNEVVNVGQPSDMWQERVQEKTPPKLDFFSQDSFNISFCCEAVFRYAATVHTKSYQKQVAKENFLF